MMSRKIILKLIAFVVLLNGLQLSWGQKLSTPERIISLAPSLTKNLALLHAEEKLVGCTNFCNIDSENVRVVANAMQVNYEQIVLLEPDLIITTTLTNTRTINTFRKLGIKVKVFENPEDYNMICNQFIELGEMLGLKEKANSLINGLEDRMNNLKKQIPNNDDEQAEVFMQLGSKPLFAVVPGTFMNDYITLSGTSNIASDLKIGSINLESVLIRDPDVIFIVLMGMVGEDEKQKWKRFEQLNAVKNNRIYTLDADKACSPTPVSFIETLEDIVQKLYLNQ